MKKVRIGTMMISILILCAIAVNLTGCAPKDSLSHGSNDSPNFSSQHACVTDFALRLFRECEEPGKNTLISPLSVICALAMTANGAEEETLSQMESVLGMTAGELNDIYGLKHEPRASEQHKLVLRAAHGAQYLISTPARVRLLRA